MIKIKKQISSRSLAIVFVTVFILSLIPLIHIAVYNHPSADDFGFSQATANTWKETGSLLQVCITAVQTVKETFRIWQGTYSGIFLMSLQPAIFGEEMYFVGTIILIFFLVLGNVLLFKEVLLHYLHAKKSTFFIITSFILLATMQFMYLPVEGIYWYNGSIFYTFFYSLSLILFALILQCYRTKNTIMKAFLILLCFILIVIIGGGNYTTALIVPIILTVATIYLIFKKNKHFILLGAFTLISLAFLFISMTAPGNAIRQATIEIQPNPIKAIFLSFVFGGYSIANSTTFPIVISWIFLTPFIYKLAKNSNYTFRFPLLFSLLTFCIYSAQATPPIYALGISIPERLINIIYYSYYLLIGSNLFYFCGWISRRLEDKNTINKSLISIFNFIKEYSLSFFLLMCGLFIFGCVGRCAVEKDIKGAKFSNLPTSCSAMVSVLSGEAKTYSDEVYQRILLYKNSKIEDVVVSEFSEKPFLLYENDITPNPDDWRNTGLASYYGKNSIIQK